MLVMEAGGSGWLSEVFEENPTPKDRHREDRREKYGDPSQPQAGKDPNGKRKWRG